MPFLAQDADALLLDQPLPNGSDLPALEKVLIQTPSQPVIVLTEVKDDRLAQNAHRIPWLREN